MDEADSTRKFTPGQVTTIVSNGDALLQISHNNQSSTFRVSSARLRSVSKFFHSMLDPDKYAEGHSLSEQLAALHIRFTDPGDAPDDSLPIFRVQDLGAISRVTSPDKVIRDFLRLIHHEGPGCPLTIPPVINIANLTVLADRFAALPWWRQTIQRSKWLTVIEGRKADVAGMTEDRIRQRVFIGAFADHAPWVSSGSRQLIMRGSELWTSHASTKEDSTKIEDGMWWNLPLGLEMELRYRRECILDTFASLMNFFVQLYTSRERQCRLGYDDSKQCDSYQLGEIIRHFTRRDLLHVRSGIYDVDTEQVIYAGHIDKLLVELRGCYEYQINRNHSHCGLRTRILPILEELAAWGIPSAELCWSCWQSRRDEIAWWGAKRPMIWIRPSQASSYARRGPQPEFFKRPCLEHHLIIRDMFTAVERVWVSPGHKA